MPKKEVNQEYLACPLRQVLHRFGDKWSMLVLYSIDASQTGVLRFSELSALMFDCSQKMLSKTLRELQESQLISRKVYPEVPPRVEYKLTEAGKSLIPHIQGLIDWGKEHYSQGAKP